MFTIYTKSGSAYFFTAEANTLRFSKNGVHEGIVVSLENMHPGKQMRIKAHMLDPITSKPQDCLSIITTSPIVAIA